MNDQVKDEHSFRHQLLSWQSGSAVTRIQPGIVRKKGHKVRPPEEKALRLVKQYAPQVPIPSIHAASYRFENGLPVYGKLDMDFMPGRTLKSAWAELDEGVKDRVCRDIWDLIAAIRESVPRPADLAPGRYRTVDGSPSLDHLLGDSTDVAPPELNEDTIRDRICAWYIARGGLSFDEGRDVLAMLPRSRTSVFTHGNIGPRSLIVDEDCHISAVLGWESSGWFPDYWEYAQMMSWHSPDEHEWQHWMTKTKPKLWDIAGIQKARQGLLLIL